MAEKISVKNLSQGIDSETIMAQYDREYAYRRFQGPMKYAVSLIAVTWAILQLYTAAYGVFPPTLQRAPHVGFALVLVFLLYPFKTKNSDKGIPWYDYILVVLSIVVAVYHIVEYEGIIYRVGLFNKTDTIISIIAVLLVIEATRRIAGPVLVSLATFFLLYAYFGQYFPGLFSHRGYNIYRIATYGWLQTESILGIPIMVSSTFIFLFLVFASFLKKTGIGDWLTDLALAIAGHATGGPAKAAIVASATQGTVSGSSVANTVGTGSITIPLMKSIGYRSEFAAAVEAAASTGGQLMPPIMGAAAFIMTEFTNLPYITIALSAAIPALLYFTGIFVMVHLEAKKTGLRGLPKSQLPSAKKLLKEKWFLSLPIFGIIYFLASGQSPMKAAFYGIVLTVLVSLIRKDTRIGFKGIIEGLEEGARSALPVVMACATAGVIVGVVTLTGLGLKLAHGIVKLSGGNIYLTMMFTMVASIILGMGMPTTANYIIQATIAAPALITVGVPVIAAHLFVFYFGIIADITPPVALAAFAGSGIAGSNPFRTGIQASKLAFAAYLVPYIFATSPVLVLHEATPVKLTIALVTALIGMVGIGGGVSGFLLTNCRAWERVLLFAVGLGLVVVNWKVNLVAGAIFVLIFLMLRNRAKKEEKNLKEQNA